jgi:hypothetical protein
MNKKILVLGAVTSLCSLFFTLESSSQNPASATVAFRIAPSLSLSVWGENATGNSLISVYTIPRPTAQERQAGFIEHRKALQLLARGNVPWVLRVHAQEPDMGLSDDGTYRKPVSDLAVRVATGPYVLVMLQDQVITSGSPGEHLLPVDYRVRLGDEHRDGNYRVTLIYTLTSR